MYEQPEVTEYGNVEAITLSGHTSNNKCGNAEDQYSGQVPIVGSIVPADCRT